MAAAIVPAIQLGISAYSAYKKNKARKKAEEEARKLMQRTPEAQAAYGNLTGQAGELTQRGDTMMNAGSPLLSRASQYFQALMGGNRAAMNAELAPERAGIADSYKGAGKSVSLMRGPARDRAAAELNRERAGMMALLPAQARSQAIAGGADLGKYFTSSGMDAKSRGASLYAAALGSEDAVQATRLGQNINQGYLGLARDQASGDDGEGMGSLFGQLATGIMSYYGSRGMGGGGGMKTTNWSAPYSPYQAALQGAR